MFRFNRSSENYDILPDIQCRMIGGSSLRQAIVNFGCLARQTRAFASPIRNFSPTLVEQTKWQRHSKYCGFTLRNARTLHTPVKTDKEDPLQETAANEKDENKLTLKERLKIVVQEYGSTAIVFHVGISLTSLGLCYAAVKSGIDVQVALQKIGVNPKVSESAVATEASTFVVAYACHKVFAPLRMLMTITCTPLIVRKLRRMGFMKQPVKQ